MTNEEIKIRIQEVITILKDDHIKNNKFRLGILGSQDIDNSIALLQQIIDNVDN